MSQTNFLKFDLKKFNELKNQLPKGASEALDRFQSQLLNYEEKVVDLVKSIEERQLKVRRDVEKLGKERLSQFASDLKKTRSTVEKKVLNLISEKRKDLQTSVNDLVIYLSGLAGKDVLKKASPKNQTKSKRSTSKKMPPPSSGRKTKAKRSFSTPKVKLRPVSTRTGESLSPA